VPTVEQRIAEAQEILSLLGLPTQQQNEISGLTLLALANIRPGDPWSAADDRPIRIHDIFQFMREWYSKDYAENTRETVRRQVLHQFCQACLAIANKDEPQRPTNSPHFNYALTDETLALVRQFGSSDWEEALAQFRSSHEALKDVYRKRREQQLVPVVLPDGKRLVLSPGRHNELQAAVVREFAARFVPGAHVIYMCDAHSKAAVEMPDLLEALGVPLEQHGKLPDVVLATPDHKTLILVEAVTSHGPVTPKRYLELEELLAASGARRLYVSALPGFKEFRDHINEIAWETEVWISAIPDHMIHYNGEKFLEITGRP